jgi:hypothetical protein
MKIDTVEQAIAVIESAGFGYRVNTNTPKWFKPGTYGLCRNFDVDMFGFPINKQELIEFARKLQLKAFW